MMMLPVRSRDNRASSKDFVQALLTSSSSNNNDDDNNNTTVLSTKTNALGGLHVAVEKFTSGLQKSLVRRRA